ncbi:MAG: dethiobiotin synthase [Cyclobacteriaceae bacterium]
MRYFVTAIGTDSGKTIVSAMLCQMLNADYWKPVQCGYPRDTDSVSALTGTGITFHQESYLLQMPASPHAAAKDESVEIKLSGFEVPVTSNDLVIEGAGGALVPLNDQDYVIDLVERFEAQVVLVANLYLGSINHTLLTIEALKSRKLSVKGIVFNGPSNEESERIILQKSGWKCLGRINHEENVDTEMVIRYAALLKKNWHEELA